MAQCVSKRCKAKVETGWIFCAYCGTDNRPPTFRPVILACPHKFHESEGFCVRCGVCRDGRSSAAEREVQQKIGRTFFGFGLFAIAAAAAVWQIHVNAFPGIQFVQPWYDEVYLSEGKRMLRGDDYASWTAMGGGALCAIGVAALIFSKLNSAKPRSRKMVGHAAS